MASAKSPPATPSTALGAYIYSRPLFLRLIYDIWVLRITCTWIWLCSTSSILLPFFRKHTKNTTSHLDVGVGTGFFLANAGFNKDTEVTLMDLNPDSLEMAKNRIPRLKTQSILHDITRPLPIPSNQKFTSISLIFLLHCLPGPASHKANIFRNLESHLTDDGTLFGATVLGKGVEHNWAGKRLMRLYNRKGIFGNWDDGAEEFLEVLKECFDHVDAKVEGMVLLFAVRGPKDE